MKAVLVITVLIIGYIFFLEEEDLVEQVKQTTNDVLVISPGNETKSKEDKIRSIIKSLPIIEQVEKAAETMNQRKQALEDIDGPSAADTSQNNKQEYVRQAYDSLTLKGTIYGSDDDRAMLVGPNGQTIYARVGDKIPATNYVLSKIERNRVIVEKQGKAYLLYIQK